MRLRISYSWGAVAAAVVALAGAAPLRAQPSDMTARLVQELKTRLGLSEEQAAKVEALARQREEKRKAARSAEGSPEARQERREIMREFQTGVEAILTDEQKPRYAAFLAERREEMRKRRRGGEPGEPPPPPSPSPSPKP